VTYVHRLCTKTNNNNDDEIDNHNSIRFNLLFHYVINSSQGPITKSIKYIIIIIIIIIIKYERVNIKNKIYLN
jgi:hypothetical protein